MNSSPPQRLNLSANRRFLVRGDDRPLFWLGDTAWELFHRTTIEEAEHYLENRRQKGFTVVQAVVLAELDGLNTPNAYHECPLMNHDPLRPNENFFRYIDRVIDLAGQKDLHIGLLPTWGDKLERLHFGKGPVIFNPDNAFQYGQWIGRRYRDYPNIVWINGGDRPGGGENYPIWDALARGIKSVDANHLMTFHPPGGGDGRSSSEWFHECDWLDFNLAQSGHERINLPNYAIVSHDYNLTPVKPCLDGEPRYEDHGVNWKPQELGWFDDYDVRQAAYWAVFAGAFGHTYGCHAVWQMFQPGREPVNSPRRHWLEALDLPGAGQMIHLKNLMRSRPFVTRVPDQSLAINVEPGTCDQARATRDSEGRYAFIYLPFGGQVAVNLTPLRGQQIKAWWYDPRTGAARLLGHVKRSAAADFAAPETGRGHDWVLVLDDAALEFAPPGKGLL